MGDRGGGGGGGEDGEDNDSMLRGDHTLDSSALSDNESASGQPPLDSPLLRLPGKPLEDVATMNGSDQLSMDSPLSPIIKEDDDDDTEVSHRRASPFMSAASSPSVPASSSPRQTSQPPRHYTPHTIDSFLFSSPPLRLPYPMHPPSPLAAALPMPYLGFPRLPYPLPHSPHTPNGSPFSLDLKPIV